VAFCTGCGAALEQNAHFCSSCGAPAEGVTPADPKRYSGLFGTHHRDSDFRAKVEQALAGDVLTLAQEQRLLNWTQAQGITQEDWGKKFRDLLDRMLIASVNNGRLPDVTAHCRVVLKTSEMAHYLESASL
jgi:hypothetical protein